MKILAKEGDHVDEGDPIAIIEAMKMEMSVIAKASGEVDRIFVKEGQQVSGGELIAVLK